MSIRSDFWRKLDCGTFSSNEKAFYDIMMNYMNAWMEYNFTIVKETPFILKICDKPITFFHSVHAYDKFNRDSEIECYYKDKNEHSGYSKFKVSELFNTSPTQIYEEIVKSYTDELLESSLLDKKLVLLSNDIVMRLKDEEGIKLFQSQTIKGRFYLNENNSLRFYISMGHIFVDVNGILVACTNTKEELFYENIKKSLRK